MKTRSNKGPKAITGKEFLARTATLDWSSKYLYLPIPEPVEKAPFGPNFIPLDRETIKNWDKTVQKQCEEKCQRAIKLINQQEAPKKYELVEAFFTHPITARGFWVHINLKARCVNPDGNGDSTAELYFVEINLVKSNVTSFQNVEPTSATPAPVRGCRFCTHEGEVGVYHPGNSDYGMK